MSDALTEADIERLAALLAASTPGEWAWYHNTMVLFSDMPKFVLGSANDEYGDLRPNQEDAALIVAMHNALPALLSAARYGLKWREFSAAFSTDLDRYIAQIQADTKMIKAKLDDGEEQRGATTDNSQKGV